MSKSRQHKLQIVSSAERPKASSGQESSKSGKVTHDARGNAVWDWDIATGVLARKSVDELISSLDAPGTLRLDGDSEPGDDWAGDPYNRTMR
jgi:hypothetical protein